MGGIINKDLYSGFLENFPSQQYQHHSYLALNIGSCHCPCFLLSKGQLHALTCLCIFLGEVEVDLQLPAVDVAPLQGCKSAASSKGAVECHHDLSLGLCGSVQGAHISIALQQ